MFETIFADFERDELFALATFIKRVTWSDIRSNAKDDIEAEIMRDAIVKLGRALEEEGYNAK